MIIFATENRILLHRIFPLRYLAPGQATALAYGPGTMSIYCPACDQNFAEACRFCGEELKQPSPSMLPAFKSVCRKGDCFEMMQKSCDKMLACGHFCCGTKGENECMPCLRPECIEKGGHKIKP